MSALIFLPKIYTGFDYFILILQYALLAYCVMSWFSNPGNRLYILLSRIAQPLLAPFRSISNRLIQRGFRLDLSAIFAFIALSMLRRLLPVLFNWLITLSLRMMGAT